MHDSMDGHLRFDPAVVRAFCEMIGPGDRAPAPRTAPFRRPAEAA